MKYERLTTKDKDGNWKVWEDDYSHPFEALQVAIDRLAELEDKIENGTLIELPCKVGDKFWCINETKHGLPFVSDMTVEYFKIINGVVYMGNFNCFRIKAWQKSELFLTREEAEKKLKELQNG